METLKEPARTIPVARNTGVVVVGGGPAGLAAAIASARTGARTTLIERFGFLGGTATAGLMANLNGFRNQVEPDSTQTVRGIAEEIVLEVKKLGGTGKSPYEQKEYPGEPGKMSYSYAVDTEILKHVCLKICLDAGLDIMLHTFFCVPIMEGSRVTGVIVENKSGRSALLAKTVVDASGDGDVAARAGVPFWSTMEKGEPRLGNSLMYKVRLGKGRPQKLFVPDFGSNIVVWGPFGEPIDATDADLLSRAEIDTRMKVLEHFSKLKSEHPEFADAELAETPAMLGIRQTRFIEGEYKITGDDAIEGRRFEDSVAMSSCPIISYFGYRRYLAHEGYDIPYRCLVPQKAENLLVAGRCISSDQQAYESHRAMLPMMAVGQAAGAAAALCALNGVSPRNLDVKSLKQALAGQNAVLGLGAHPIA